MMPGDKRGDTANDVPGPAIRSLPVQQVLRKKLDLRRSKAQRESLGPAIRSLALSFEEKTELRWSKAEPESLGPAVLRCSKVETESVKPAVCSLPM